MKPQFAQQLLQQVEADYNTIAQHFSQTRNRQWDAVTALIEQYIRPNQRVLDLGCGNGRVSEIIKKIKADYVGMDISSGLISQAKERYPQEKFLVGNMMQTGFPDQSFDHIIMIASFHHLPSREFRLQTLKELRRILRPGGYLLMTNWNLHQTAFLWQRLQHGAQKLFGQTNIGWNDLYIPWKDAHGSIQAQRYYHGFTLRELHTLAEDSRFRIVEQYYELHGTRVTRRAGQNCVSIFQAQ